MLTRLFFTKHNACFGWKIDTPSRRVLGKWQKSGKLSHNTFMLMTTQRSSVWQCCACKTHSNLHRVYCCEIKWKFMRSLAEGDLLPVFCVNYTSELCSPWILFFCKFVVNCTRNASLRSFINPPKILDFLLISHSVPVGLITQQTDCTAHKCALCHFFFLIKFCNVAALVFTSHELPL